MKRASVYLHDYKAGTLTEDENGYTFLYDKDFLESAHAEAINGTECLYYLHVVEIVLAQ